MNKKAAGGVSALISTFLTAGLIYAFIVFIIFILAGTGGGFKMIYNIGGLLSKIPVWFYLVLAILWFASKLRN